MAMSSDNVQPFRPGGGGRIYRDARVHDEQRTTRAAQELETDIITLAQPDAPQPKEAPEAPAPKPSNVIHPQFQVGGHTVGQVQAPSPEPEPEPQPEIDWGEFVSVLLQIIGLIVIAVCIGGWANPWAGGLFAGIALVVFGVASSRRFSG